MIGELMEVAEDVSELVNVLSGLLGVLYNRCILMKNNKRRFARLGNNAKYIKGPTFGHFLAI